MTFPGLEVAERWLGRGWCFLPVQAPRPSVRRGTPWEACGRRNPLSPALVPGSHAAHLVPRTSAGGIQVRCPTRACVTFQQVPRSGIQLWGFLEPSSQKPGSPETSMDSELEGLVPGQHWGQSSARLQGGGSCLFGRGWERRRGALCPAGPPSHHLLQEARPGRPLAALAVGRHRDPRGGLSLGAGVTGLRSPCGEPLEGMMRVVPGWVGSSPPAESAAVPGGGRGWPDSFKRLSGF